MSVFSRSAASSCRVALHSAAWSPPSTSVLRSRQSSAIFRQTGDISSTRRQQLATAAAPPLSKKPDPESGSSASKATVSNISKSGFSDAPLPVATVSAPSATQAAGQVSQEQVDWTRSFQGLSTEPFPKEAADVLQAPLDPEEVEIKPDGILYLPEIKYRRILNRAFGPGGWGLAPRGETIVTERTVTREYALVVLGRLVSVARGEQDYFNQDGIPTAAEGCKSNALTRCCKDLGIASELWDPRFIRSFMKKNIKEVWVEHQTTNKKKKIYMRRDGIVSYPFKEIKS